MWSVHWSSPVIVYTQCNNDSEVKLKIELYNLEGCSSRTRTGTVILKAMVPELEL